MNSKHTSGLWEISTNAQGDVDVCAPGAGDMIADLRDCNNADANAAFIVRACNAHDDLLAALTKANEALTRISEWRVNTSRDACDIARGALIETRAALAKAQGE